MAFSHWLVETTNQGSSRWSYIGFHDMCGSCSTSGGTDPGRRQPPSVRTWPGGTGHGPAMTNAWPWLIPFACVSHDIYIFIGIFVYVFMYWFIYYWIILFIYLFIYVTVYLFFCSFILYFMYVFILFSYYYHYCHDCH